MLLARRRLWSLCINLLGFSSESASLVKQPLSSHSKIPAVQQCLNQINQRCFPCNIPRQFDVEDICHCQRSYRAHCRTMCTGLEEGGPHHAHLLEQERTLIRFLKSHYNGEQLDFFPQVNHAWNNKYDVTRMGIAIMYYLRPKKDVISLSKLNVSRHYLASRYCSDDMLLRNHQLHTGKSINEKVQTYKIYFPCLQAIE